MLLMRFYPILKNISIRKVIIFESIFIAALSIAILFSKNIFSNSSNKQNSNKEFEVIIDAGHGGVDEGTKGINGLKEKNITLAIAKTIQMLSPQYGIKTVLTRTSDVFMNPRQRVNFAMQHEDANAYLSIHVNELRGYSYVSGMQIYVSANNKKFDECRKFGSAVADCLNNSFKVFPRLQDRAKNIYVLNQSPMPAILVECGFITNSNDAHMLSDSAKVYMIARQILSGVKAYKDHDSIQMYAVQMPSSNINKHHKLAAKL